jgi:hypothetical protein
MPVTSSVIVSSFACMPAGNKSAAIADPKAAHKSLRRILSSFRADYSTVIELCRGQMKSSALSQVESSS